MLLKDFIEQTMAILGTAAGELVVEPATVFRNNPGPASTSSSTN
jgi:hypothetical protein